MKYFGVPTCPYCRKRVNLIRTWSLKRQGEYRCPRCGGISNIYLSPLVYVFALLAIFSAGALYFFRKFVLNDITLKTLLEVVIPFAAFFLLSLFMVYLEKPVIKTVSRAELEQRKRGKPNFESRRAPASQSQNSQMFYDADEYLPKTDYRTGPLPPAPGRVSQDEMAKTSVVDVSRSAQAQRQAARQPAPRVEPPTRRAEESPVARRSEIVRPETSGAVRTAPARQTASAQQGAQAQRPALVRPAASNQAVSPVQQVARQNVPQQPSQSAQARPAQVRPVRPDQPAPQTPAPQTAAPASESVMEVIAPGTAAAKTVTSVEVPSVTSPGDDFFSKYDDPAYVERRLKELNEKKNRG